MPRLSQMSSRLSRAVELLVLVLVLVQKTYSQQRYLTILDRQVWVRLIIYAVKKSLLEYTSIFLTFCRRECLLTSELVL